VPANKIIVRKKKREKKEEKQGWRGGDGLDR
jgi:hypothetical protein